MAENEEELRNEPQDEPQFTAPEQNSPDSTKKRSVAPLVLMLSVGALAVGAVIMFVFGGGLNSLLNKKPNVETRQITVVEPSLRDQEIPEPVIPKPVAVSSTPVVESDFEIQLLTNSGTEKKDREVESGDGGTPTEPGAGVQISSTTDLAVVLREIKHIQSSIDSLDRKVTTVRGELMSVHRALGQQNIDVEKAIEAVSKKVGQLQSASEREISKIDFVLRGVEGFKSEAQRKREAFNFKVLHHEVYAGKARLIGFDLNSPSTVVKVFVGGEIGLWRLKAIADGFAEFEHRDGSVHREPVS